MGKRRETAEAASTMFLASGDSWRYPSRFETKEYSVRQGLRILGWTFWSLLSLDVAIYVLDWLARWDWLKQLMLSHPLLNKFVHTPFIYLALLILGFAFLTAERKLKQPKIVARLMNSRTKANLDTTPIGALLDSEVQSPAWDTEPIDWEWFAEVQLANYAETPATIGEVKARAWIRRKIWQRKISIPVQHEQDLDSYEIDVSLDDNYRGRAYSGERYREVVGLMNQISNVHLTRGIGHRGWLRFEIPQVSRRDIGKVKVKVWLVDALQGKHRVHHSRKSEQQWDHGFVICAK